MESVLDALSALSESLLGVLSALSESLLGVLSGLSPESLLADPPRVESLIYLVPLGVFTAVFVAGVATNVLAGRLSRGNRLHRRLLERYGTWAGWLGGLGILVIGLRYAHVPLLSKRLWTVMDSLAIFALAAHLVYYRLRRYPAELAAYEAGERRRRFTAGRRPGASSRRPQRR